MRLRFTIRDLLWLTALIAMAIGWWLDHDKWSSLARDALDRGTRLAKERDEIVAAHGTLTNALRSRAQLEEFWQWKQAQQSAK